MMSREKAFPTRLHMRPAQTQTSLRMRVDITKTNLFKYTENYTTKKIEKFSDKKSDIFLISAQKHRLWVLVRTASARRF